MGSETTICALSTPPGSGAIGVIRLSGDAAFEICNRLFKSKNLLELSGHTVHFGKIMAGDEVVDEVVLTLFKGPNSYTGEDVVEISCHGSTYIRQRILQLLIEGGAQAAAPGEFTMRAYLNGKMDLSQSEAVADLIAANSASAHRIAMNQMRGGYSEKISALRQELINFASLIELELDFSEEDVEFADRSALEELLDRVLGECWKLVDSFAVGNVIKEGIPVAIVGAPNAGKSTLLNYLLDDDRAIVSSIAGTTRDVIEDEVNLGGTIFRFIDTAGIRQTEDEIESIGIRKAFEKMEKAAVVLFMIDCTQADEAHVQERIASVTDKMDETHGRLVVLFNKADQVDEAHQQKLVTTVPEDMESHMISAKLQQNTEVIKTALIRFADEEQEGAGDVLVSNARHYEALLKASESLNRVVDGMSSGITGDFLAMDIRQALHHLGEITGEITADDLLGNIFANFCIGK